MARQRKPKADEGRYPPPNGKPRKRRPSPPSDTPLSPTPSDNGVSQPPPPPPPPADPPECSPGKSVALPGRVASTIEPGTLRWLIPGMIPRGVLTLAVGPPSAGKSTLGAWLALNARRSVILPGHEESVDIDLVRRLAHAGVSLWDVLILDGRPWSLPPDRDRLTDVMIRWGADLLWIDPIDSYCTLQSMNDNDGVRASLEAFSQVAHRTGAAVVGARHPGKDPANVCPGGMQWRAVPRLIWEMVPSPDDPMRGVMRPWKAYGGVSRLPLRYDLLGVGNEPRQIEFGDQVHPSEVECMSYTDLDDRHLIDQAMELLRGILAEGEMLSTDVYNAASKEELKPRLVRAALRRLGGKSRREGVGRDHRAYWSLPHSGTLADTDRHPPLPQS